MAASHHPLCFKSVDFKVLDVMPRCCDGEPECWIMLGYCQSSLTYSVPLASWQTWTSVLHYIYHIHGSPRDIYGFLHLFKCALVTFSLLKTPVLLLLTKTVIIFVNCNEKLDKIFKRKIQYIFTCACTCSSSTCPSCHSGPAARWWSLWPWGFTSVLEWGTVRNHYYIYTAPYQTEWFNYLLPMRTH